LIFGSYIHGLFHNTQFTLALLNRLRGLKGLPHINSSSIDKQQQYDRLAQLIRQNLDMPRIYQITLRRSK
jgi:adenosylcobyric acid synthase